MRIPRWNLFQIGIVLVALPVISQLIIAGLLIWLLNEAESERQRETQAKIRLKHCNEAARQMSRVTSLTLSSLLPGPADEEERRRNIYKAREHISLLRKMPAFSSEEKINIDRFADVFDKCSDVFLKSQGTLNDELRILNLLNSGKGLTQRLFAEGERLANTDYLTETGAGSRKAIQLILIVGLVLNIVVAFTLARVFAIAIRERIGRVTENSILLADGKPLQLPMQGDDEISELDRQFHKTADALYEAQRLKQRFVAMVSHDLRSPLTSMLSSMHLIATGGAGQASEEVLAHAQVADRNLRRLINLVNDLLDAERLSSGLMPMQLENILIAPVIENAIEAVQNLADEKNIDIVADGSLLQVYGDRGKLIQVLVNLLSNAIKYSPEGATITVLTEANSEYTEIQVIDNGKGIAKEYQQYIFEQFKQVDITDTDSSKGSGLGLSICKAIVEQHCGEIGVRSEPGKGSTFWFRIPAKRTSAKA